jgi:hypothetical protein
MSALNDFSNPTHLQGCEGEVYFWIEQGSSIMLKAVSNSGDPVELTALEARDLAGLLIKAADELERT